MDPLLCRSICHAPWPQVNPIVHPTSYPTHIPFIPSESNLPLLSYSNFHILPWKSKVKIMGEIKVWSQNVSLTFYRLTFLSFHFNGPSHSWLLRYFFKIWPWKSKVKVMVESYKVGATSYRLTSLSFHVNRPSRSWDTAFSKFDLENPRSRSWVKSKFEVTMWV